MPPPPLLQRLKERKLVQWALAYLAGAWVIYEATGTALEAWDIPVLLVRSLHVLLVVGFFLALVIAWYHGEKGQQRVSGPELLMVAALLVVAGVALSIVPNRSAGPSTVVLEGDARPAVAVLVCENFSPDEDDAYFASGIHDEILQRLSKISAIRSIGRSSVEWYRDNPTPLRQMARELGVGFVGECSVRKDVESEQIRLTFQLLDGNTGTQLWAENYDESLRARSIFDIQSDIAQRVARAMRAALTPEEREQVEIQTTENIEAYEYYLRGNEQFWRRDEETDNRLAIQMFESAVAEDSTFALAYAQLATSYCRVWWYFQDRTEGPRASAEAAMNRAVALAPQHPQVQEALGYYHYWCGMAYDSAAAAFSQALARGSSPTAYYGLACVQRRQGPWEESLANFRMAAEHDPQSWLFTVELGTTLKLLRQFSEAEEKYQRALELTPGDPGSFAYLVEVYVGEDAGTARARAVWDRADALGIDSPDLAFWSVKLDVFDRRFDAAVRRLDSIRWEVDEDQQFHFIPKSLWYGRAYHWIGEEARSQAQYDSARARLENLLRESPDDSRLHSSLGLALAGLGRAERALREARLGVELMPLSKDAWRGAIRLGDLAEVLALVGDHDSAIEVLDSLLSVPGPISTGILRLDPTWDPLRSHPRFQALLEKHGRDTEH